MLIRTQAIQCLATVIGKGGSTEFKICVLSLMVRMKNSGNPQKKTAVSRLISKLAEMAKSADEQFKNVSGM